MGKGNYAFVIGITVLTVLFMNYPPPELSHMLKNWHRRGTFHKFKEFSVFYIVEDGVMTDDSTVVCIHGFPTSSYDWIKVLDGLKEQYSRVILLDMLGFGFSDKPRPHDYLITEQASIVTSLLKSLDITEAHVLSHDYGDTVALELLHRHNQNEAGSIKLKSLCMLNGGVFPETNHPRPIQKALQIPYFGEFLCYISFYQVFKRGFGQIFGPHTQPTEEDLQDFYAAERYNKGHLVLSRLIDYIHQRSVNKERWVGALQKSTVPVHMIQGPADLVNPSPAFEKHFKKMVPKASIHVIKHPIGHYPQWEDPVEVMKSYSDFLETISR